MRSYKEKTKQVYWPDWRLLMVLLESELYNTFIIYIYVYINVNIIIHINEKQTTVKYLAVNLCVELTPEKMDSLLQG